MKSAIKKQLLHLGLSEKDISVYFAIIQLGVAKAMEIARKIDLPRQTVYSILQQLLRLKLIEQHDKRGIKHFSADPRELVRCIERERERLTEEQRQIEKELPELEALKYRAAPLPKIRYYEGTEGMKRLFYDILDQHRGGVKEFRGYGVNRFQKALGDFLYEFVKKRFSYGVKTKLLIGQGEDDFGITGEKNAYGRLVKRMNISEQDAGFYLVGDRAYLFSYPDNLGISIENRNITKLLSSVFDDHWQRLRG